MKKIIAVSLSIITIIICGYLIASRMDLLDIPTNKNEWYVMDSIRKIGERTDIDDCEKKVLIKEVELRRENEKYNSGLAFQTQLIAFVIIITQVFLLIFIILMPSKTAKKSD